MNLDELKNQTTTLSYCICGAEMKRGVMCPGCRLHYEENLRRWNKKLAPITESIRKSQRITGEDLNIIVY